MVYNLLLASALTFASSPKSLEGVSTHLHDLRDDFYPKVHAPTSNYYYSTIQNHLSHSSESGMSKREGSLMFDTFEVGKIAVMSTFAAVVYGITHNLIATQVNFGYFASYGYMRKNFPYVYQSRNKVLYALLWGTISTWWIGLPLGVLWGVTARWGDNKPKLGWYNLLKPTGILLGSVLGTSLIVGIGQYPIYQSTNSVVSGMNTAAYVAGILGGLAMVYYIHDRRNASKPIVQFKINGINIDSVASLLGKY